MNSENVNLIVNDTDIKKSRFTINTNIRPNMLEKYSLEAQEQTNSPSVTVWSDSWIKQFNC